MKKLCVALIALLMFVGSASATPKHYRHAGHRHVHSHVTSDRFLRPTDCYGIPWCGCWLRHQFGLNDKTLNLARAWKRYSRAEPCSANVVVWPSGHHVGKVLQCQGDKVQVISGNAGRNSGIPVWIRITRGFSFHRV